MYAIVDIETTGGYAAANGIIEISIKVFDGQSVVEEFETLVNPHQNIPRYIQAFTGITNEMVVDATAFLFKKIMDHDLKGIIQSSLHRNSKEQVLPPNVPKTNFDALPSDPGV